MCCVALCGRYRHGGGCVSILIAGVVFRQWCACWCVFVMLMSGVLSGFVRLDVFNVRSRFVCRCAVWLYDAWVHCYAVLQTRISLSYQISVQPLFNLSFNLCDACISFVSKATSHLLTRCSANTVRRERAGGGRRVRRPRPPQRMREFQRNWKLGSTAAAVGGEVGAQGCDA